MLLASQNRTTPRASRRWTAAVVAAVFGTALVVSGIGFARPADDKKPEDKKPEDKKTGDKKPEDKKPAIDPKDVRIGPPAELMALREAVEEAAKKGENVEEIRKQLDALEKVLAGKAWVKPTPVEPPPAAPLPPGRVQPPGGFPPGGFPPGIAIAPVGPFGPDQEAVQKAQELMKKAHEMLLKDPNDAEARKLLQEAQAMMMRAMVRPPAMVPGRLAPGFGGEGRFGVRIQAVPPALVDQLDLPKDQGLIVVDVVKGTPADKAGLKPNDVLIEFGGKPVPSNPGEFVRMVTGTKKDEKVDITFVRKGKKETAKGIELPEAKPGAVAPGGLGFEPFPGVNPPDIAVPLVVGLPEPPAVALPALPAPPAPPPLPLVPLPDPGALPALPAPPALPPAPGGAKQSRVQVQVENGTATIQAEEDGITYQIEATAAAGKLTPTKIVITDAKGQIASAATVEKIPAAYRDRVKQLLESVKLK